MSILKIQQTTLDGRKKSWKIDAKKGQHTFGASRKSDFNSIDRLSTPFDAAIESRADGWHFINFDINQQTPDVSINNETIIQLHESRLTFEIIEKDNFVLKHLEQEEALKNGNLQKKILVVLRHNKIIHTEVKSLNHNFKYTLNGIQHDITASNTTQWLTQQIEGFTFKTRIISADALDDITQIPKEMLLDKESKKMAYITLVAMFIFVSVGIILPKNQISTAEIVLPKTHSALILKTEPKKPAKKTTANTQPTQVARAQSSSESTGGARANSLIRGAVGVRISQLLGKVSATEARTAQVIIAAKGVKAGEAPSGRSLAALGKVEASGRNWSGEAVSANGKSGVSTAGAGGGNGIGHLGQGLNAGKTGSGGVGLLEEESEITGGLDREVIAQYIKSQLGQILYCYERQLSANPELYGKVAVKFTIVGTGHVESQAINQTTLKSLSVEGCILSKIAKWKFPEPKGGTKVVVTYPFLFKSTN